MNPEGARAGSADVDPAWNGGQPRHLTDLGYGGASAQVVSEDGSTYVAGDGNGDVQLGLVTKFRPDGTLDPTFGTRTLSLGPVDPVLSRVSGATLLSGGRIAVAGIRYDRWTVVGLTPNGDVDQQLGIVELTDIAGHDLHSITSPTVLAATDDSLVLAGYVRNGSEPPRQLAIVRLLADGSLDQTFGTGGLVLDPIPPEPQGIVAAPIIVRIDSVGRLLIGRAQVFGGSVIFRLSSGGLLDPSFGVAGVLHLSQKPLDPCGNAFVLDAHDRILTTCTHDAQFGFGHPTVTRHGPDGTLDASFGDAGTATVPPLAAGAGSNAFAIAIQGDDVVIGGSRLASTATATPADYAVWRFNEHGRLDRTFGADGGVAHALDGASDDVRALSTAPDGGLSLLVDPSAIINTGYHDGTSLVRLRPITSIAHAPLTLLDAPVRVLDTRHDLPVGSTKLGGGSALVLPLGGTAGLPAGSTTVVLNVTVTEPEQAGYLTVYPCGQAPPTASNVNYAHRQTIANLVIVRLGTGGEVCIFSSQTAHVVADLSGAYGSEVDLHPLTTPMRMIDTRIGLGWPPGTKVGPSGLFVPPGLFTPGIARSRLPDADNSNEAIFNVTITEPDKPGYLVAHACGTTTPLASNMNFAAGETISNLVAVRMPPTPQGEPESGICFDSTARTHLVVDLEATVDIGAADIVLPTLTRVLDTRDGTGASAHKSVPEVPLEMQIAGTARVATDATAVGINVTVTEPDLPGYLTVYPCGQPRPLASNVNFDAGETIPNYVIVRLGAGGKICIVSNVSTHVVADIAEFFTRVS